MPKQNDSFDRYADMLNLPHHVSATRPRMSMHDRAAQFSPFAALTGHDAAIRETARLTDLKAQLVEDRINLLNQKIQILVEHKKAAPEVLIQYFEKDLRKDGGAYIKKAGRFKEYNNLHSVVVLTDMTEISVEQIYDISSELFDVGEI